MGSMSSWYSGIRSNRSKSQKVRHKAKRKVEARKRAEEHMEKTRDKDE